MERDEILAALKAARGNVSRAAEILGTSRRTLQSRMREHDIAPGKPGRRKHRLSYSKAGAGTVLGAAVLVGVGLVIGNRFRK